MAGKTAALAAVPLLALGLAACGGSSGLDRDELIAKADQICRQIDQRRQKDATAFFRTNPKAEDLPGFVEKKVIPTYRDELAKLKLLKGNGDTGREWDELTAKMERAISELEADPESVVKRQGTPLDAGSKAAREFGLQVCWPGN
ncbi:MAG: hypothetical protein M9938_06370 [Solirubrobacterales bacterium]|nr:hypothetical protein [Solirubrobacterales bacterium]